jgi:tetratricopeptide (TPR) repeat protein
MNPNNQFLLETYMKNELETQFNGTTMDLTDEEAAQYHPSKDIAFLERLDADAITDKEQVELLEHLAQCAFCRQEMQRLCRCGALFAQENPTNSRNAVVIVQTQSNWEKPMPSGMKFIKQWAWMGGALLLLICFMLMYSPSGNQARIAHNNILKMLNENERDFSTLLSNDYRLNGTPAIKGGIPIMDDHKREVFAAYQKLVADYPNEIDFRIEFAKYLLFVLQEPGQARNELEKSLEKSLLPSEMRRVPELHLLLGIAAFQEGDDTLALRRYRDTLDLDPKNIDARVNMAISLYRSGEKEKAVEIYRELQSESITETLRNKIDNFLENH